ncbi:MAG: OmpA family protein, partial [Paracoccaceae bacterium]
AIPVSDFSEAGAAATQSDWRPAAEAAAAIAAALEHGRVEIADGQLRLVGAVRDAAGEAAIRQATAIAEAAGWSVASDLTPPPTPAAALTTFAIHAETGPNASRPVECVAGDKAEAGRLSRLAATLTPPGGPCAVAPDAPEGWGEAAGAGLAALAALPGGEFHLAGQRMRLTLRSPTKRAMFEQVATDLRGALPEGYQLTALAGVTAPDAPSPPAAPLDAPPPLRMTHDNAHLRIEGGAPDPVIGEAIVAFARASLTQGEVEADLTYGGGFDTNWRAAAMSAISVLARMESGTASVTPEGVKIEGAVEDPLAVTELHRALAEGLTDDRVAETRFRISPAQLAAKELLPPERCANDLSALTEADPISFAPGSSEISSGSDGVIGRLAKVLVSCADGRIEIGGHTDSQGSAGGNMALSRARAESVLTRLLGAGARLSLLSARGYGEEEPIADNATEQGRARNRRIAFRAVEEKEE